MMQTPTLPTPLCKLEALKTAKEKRRYPSFFENDAPKKIRCYDNGGESADRYTIIFSGNYRKNTDGVFWYIGCSENPFSPIGVGSVGESNTQIDTPSYGHLGKKVKYDTLPINVKSYIISVYCDIWVFDFGI
jgi:hypothetical protein